MVGGSGEKRTPSARRKVRRPVQHPRGPDTVRRLLDVLRYHCADVAATRPRSPRPSGLAVLELIAGGSRADVGVPARRRRGRVRGALHGRRAGRRARPGRRRSSTPGWTRAHLQPAVRRRGNGAARRRAARLPIRVDGDGVPLAEVRAARPPAGRGAAGRGAVPHVDRPARACPSRHCRHRRRQ